MLQWSAKTPYVNLTLQVIKKVIPLELRFHVVHNHKFRQTQPHTFNKLLTTNRKISYEIFPLLLMSHHKKNIW